MRITTALLLCFVVTFPSLAIEPYGPQPSQCQLDWYDMERYAFIHFSINTFTDQEWGNGDEPADLFNPSNLDCRQWARVCSEAGLTGIIVTAKHHAGFCLWPSKYTDYTVAHTPWKGGKGDVIRELRDACDEYGLKLGIYLSPWDRNRSDYGSPSYIEYFRNQLTELLTEYGDIFEVWFDGANGGWGYYGGANENRNIDRSTYYDWPNTVALVRRLQPNCIIWNEVGPDIRWCGNEQGSVGDTNWARYNYDAHIPGEPDNLTLRTGEIDGKDFVPAEVNVSIRPGWFYHEYEDLKVKDTPKLFNIYLNSVGANSTWLLNFPIDKTGQIHPNDAKAVKGFNKYLKRVFKHNLAEKAKIEREGNISLMTFKKPVRFNLIQLREDITKGQRIKSFSVEAYTDGRWHEIAHATTVGNKRILTVESIRTDKVRVTVESDADTVLLPDIALYEAPKLKIKEDKEKYDLDRSIWQILSPSEGENLNAMIDGDKNTMAWIDKGLPTDIIIDMRQTNRMRGFRYLPDQGDYWLRGIITNFEFGISSDGGNWETIAEGEFSNIAHNPLWQVVKFKKPVEARYIRFRGVRNSKGWGDLGCAEIDVLK